MAIITQPEENPIDWPRRQRQPCVHALNHGGAHVAVAQQLLHCRYILPHCASYSASSESAHVTDLAAGLTCLVLHIDLGVMATIITTSKAFVHCNRCQGETHHEVQGECKKISQVHDEDSRTDIDFEETYTLLQCQVCGQARLRQALWNSENDASPPQFYPPPSIRRPPDWLRELEYPTQVLLNEVYSALDTGTYSVALMGIRAVLDVWVSSQTSGRDGFPQKLNELARLGTLSAQQLEVLESTFDAGSAAAHRGYGPSLADALAATEAVENVLHQHFLFPRIAKLKSNTPPRAKK